MKLTTLFCSRLIHSKSLLSLSTSPNDQGSFFSRTFANILNTSTEGLFVDAIYLQNLLNLILENALGCGKTNGKKSICFN